MTAHLPIADVDFQIPDDCRHEYMLFLHDDPVGVIIPIPGTSTVRRAFRQEVFLSLDPDGKTEMSGHVLNWVVQSQAHLREQCGKGNE